MDFDTFRQSQTRRFALFSFSAELDWWVPGSSMYLLHIHDCNRSFHLILNKKLLIWTAKLVLFYIFLVVNKSYEKPKPTRFDPSQIFSLSAIMYRKFVSIETDMEIKDLNAQ